MKSIHLLPFLITILFIYSCVENTDTNLDAPSGIISNSLTYFDGTVIEKNRNQKINGNDAWEIKIQDEDGSIVSFFWSINSSLLIKMEGNTGPFVYDITPGNDLINFSTARTIAKGQVRNENILNWILVQDVDFTNRWVYIFKFENHSNTSSIISIDAQNGNKL